MATPSVPSAFNTFIPVMNGEATAGLVVNFSRNPASFALPRWASYTPVEKWTGLYLLMTIDQCARVLDTTNNNNVWARGADCPELIQNLESFQWPQFYCQRYVYGYQLPREAEQQADFNITSQQNAVEAMRAMTSRTQKAVDTALTTASYDSSHVATATTWGGGYANAGTATDPIFKRMLETMYRRIHLDTRGTVRPSDMVVVLNPSTANIISQSAEIHSYLKESPYALAQMKGREEGQNNVWGLPPFYAGFNLVVEDSVRNPNAKGATSQAGEYIWPWDNIGMFARPGGLIAPEGAMSFSTVHVFLKEDMAVEQFDDPINRRTTSRFVDDFGVQVVAPVSGCIATAALASEPIAMQLLPGGPTPQGMAPSLPSGVDLSRLEDRISQLSTVLETLSRENSELRERLERNRPDQPRPDSHEGSERRRK